MRDALALALVRAELCRVHAAERPRVHRAGWHARARAVIERTLRSLRTPSRRLAETRPGTRANANSASPPD
jgi:hypothetical protein